MTQIKLYFIAFALVSCNVSPKKNINQVDPPWGYVYDDWEGPPLDVITYIPPKASVDTPVLMVIPGASRDAQRFHGSWLDLAKKHHFSVVTVGAKKSFFPDEHSYNAGNVFDIKGNPPKDFQSDISLISNGFLLHEDIACIVYCSML